MTASARRFEWAMGVLDRWRGRKRDGGAELAGPTAAVPPGHRVGVYGLGPLPGLATTEGGTWIAELGSSSDSAREELEGVLAALDTRRPERRRVLLASVQGTVSSLFAPANPELFPLAGLLLWSLDAAGLAGAPDASALVARLLQAIWRLARTDGAAPPLSQTVFVRGSSSPRAASVAALVRGLGVAVRSPDPSGALLVEVHRPEGVVLSALGGAPRDVEPEPWSRVVAEAQAPLRGAALTELTRRLLPGDGEPRVPAVERAPRLSRTLLACASGGEAGFVALSEELLRREVPLVARVDPETRAAQSQVFPNGLQAAPLYPDEDTLRLAARDLGAAPGSFAIAVLPPRQALQWAAEQRSALVLGVYRRPGEPLYVPLSVEAVRSLADGQIPQFPGEKLRTALRT